MRTNSIHVYNSWSLDITYPDEKIFAFNPNYIDFNVVENGHENEVKYVEVEICGRSMDVELYNHKAHASINLLLQMCFDNPRTERVKEITINCVIHETNGTSEWKSLPILLIWGSISAGERMNSFGIYNYNPEKATYERHLRWFVNLPQRIMLFNDRTFQTIIPKRAGYAFRQLTDEERQRMLVWDNTFDDTFTEHIVWADDPVMVYLRRDEQKCGLFLRWIDNFGYEQYFCFATKSVKNKASNGITFDVDMLYNGMYFGGGKYTNKERKETVTCAALNVMPMELPYIKTVTTSPIVDMYLGDDNNGNEIWVPVTVTEGENTVDTDKLMQTFEINVEIPTSVPQQL